MNTKPNRLDSEQSNLEPVAPKRRKGGCLKLILLALILSVTAAGWFYWLWQSEPEYWDRQQRFLEKHPSQERLAMAQSVETRVLQELDSTAAPGSNTEQNQAEPPGDSSSPGTQTKAPADEPDAPRQISFTVEEVNAWLDQRLEHWARTRGLNIPEFVKEPMIAIEDQKLVVAFHLDKPPIDQVVSVVTSVELKGGKAVLAVEGVRGGRFNVPGVKAASEAIKTGASGSELAEVAQKIVEVFDGKSFEPVIERNGQKLEVIDLELEEDGARVTIKPATSKK